MLHRFIKVAILIFWEITLYSSDLKYNKYAYPIIIIDNLNAVKNVSEKFLSVALDTSLIRSGHICRINSRKFINRTLALAPAFLRIGGTDADCLIFDENDTTESPICEIPNSEQELYCSENKNRQNFVMSGNVWTSINKFSEETGLQIVFDLNVLLRKNNMWDTINARKLLEYSNRFKHDIVWQLGNEPNSFQHVFGKALSPVQLSNDFQELRRLLNTFPKYNSSLIVGPDVTRPTHLAENPIRYLHDFLSTLGSSTINAVTWHQYYLNGRNTSVQDFISPATLNVLRKQIIKVKNVVQKYLPEIAIWLSETSSAFGGGAPGLSNTFVAAFLWLDKLGISARYGIDVVIRQSLYKGYYSLLDTRTLEPLPDWWVSVLYKRLVGSIVLDVDKFINESGTLRIYAHCSSEREMTQKGSVTLFGMNLADALSHFQIQINTSLETEPYISSYILTGCNGLTSRSICLNGNILNLKPDGALPEINPLKQNIGSPINLPPFSLGFWTLHGVNMAACAK